MEKVHTPIPTEVVVEGHQTEPAGGREGRQVGIRPLPAPQIELGGPRGQPVVESHRLAVQPNSRGL